MDWLLLIESNHSDDFDQKELVLHLYTQHRQTYDATMDGDDMHSPN